jgi:hypothetical protein
MVSNNAKPSGVKKMITLNRDALNAIVEENNAFGYVSSAGEIAQAYWSRAMTAMERFDVMQSVGEFKTPLLKLRACLKVVENAI